MATVAHTSPNRAQGSRPAKLLMVQGTASHVGKSVLSAGFCRIFSDLGFSVAPYKAQNMSNNSYVCLDGGEIARAQAVQAKACGLEPTVDMNPILLKPAADNLCQVVFKGRPIGSFSAREYFQTRPDLEAEALACLERLRSVHDLVIIEGAGSPAEINLKKHDFANWGVAKATQCPVVLVGDIDKGGVFAHLVGTWELLDADERALVRAFIINKFRGDDSLLEPAIEELERRTGRPTLGIVPFVRGVSLPEEDSLAARSLTPRQVGDVSKMVYVEVILLPRMSNFTDFDAFTEEDDVAVAFRAEPQGGPEPDVVILPGSKATIPDLRHLKRAGLETYIRRQAGRGIPVIGLCGGFQMLGDMVRDPVGVESAAAEESGLGLLRCETVFEPVKRTARVRAIHIESGERVEGYEIHMGRTSGEDSAQPVFRVEGEGEVRTDGARRGNLWGTYLHGVFDAPAFRARFLNGLRRAKGLPERPPGVPMEDQLAKWADVLRGCLDMARLREIIGL